MQVARIIFVLIFFGGFAIARAGTVLDFWHSYVPPQTGEKHYSFHLRSFKRGIFFGSCGIGTRAQQWAFTFNLAGPGPVYEAPNLAISNDDGVAFRVVSGRVSINEKKKVAVIDLEVGLAGSHK